MIFREVKDLSLEKMNEIVELENIIFDGGGVDRWLIKSLSHYGKIFVLEENNNIIAVAEFMAAFNKEEAYLYGICTKPSKRGVGYAKKLLIESENILKENNIKKIFLTVSPDNAGAIKLYENLNYLNLNFLKNEYGLGEDRYLFCKNI
ncbi:MAG: GNAT family N-acetyltransferase [Fusobacteriaceae bacterium]|jgi:ribosomal protein S18 acetylase RimI-like enzyme|nr:GNAT family N-acetyltransferase [Fusobacteriaceae bacterium]